MHPEFDKRQKGGSYAGNAHTPYLQNLNEALLSGNVQDARRIINRLRVEQKLTPQQLTTTLRESVNAHRPVPTGNVGTAFTRWATRSLTPDELARMRHIERVYERTATLSRCFAIGGLRHARQRNQFLAPPVSGWALSPEWPAAL